MRGISSALAALAPWIADALVVLGVLVMTVGVYGIVRMPDVYAKLHAASKVTFLGVVSFLLASFVTGDPAVIYRVTLIAVFLVLTAPVSAHVVGKAAFLRGHKMQAPDAIDESGRGLGGDGPPARTHRRHDG